MDSSEPKPPDLAPAASPDANRATPRRAPSRLEAVATLARADAASMWQSWLCRGFLLTTAVLSVLTLKGMQAEQKVASAMLEAVYSMYLVVWMHGVVFIAGSALTREQECLNEAILSRGLTRGEYLAGKLVARGLAILAMIGGVLLPSSFWAIRQDQLVRNESGYVTSNARNTRVAAWEPKKVFAAVDGRLTECAIKVGDAVRAGDVLAMVDDRALFDQLEAERRAEETARNEVSNAERRHEDAQRQLAQAEDAVARAERALIAKDLLSKVEQADRETELRSRKRDMQNAANLLLVAQEAIPVARRGVENVQARVRDARKRLGHATITAPISGYVTEVQVQAAQYVGLGSHLFTIAHLDDLELKVPIYSYEEFKRLRTGLTAYIKIGETEFTGTLEKLGATTEPDRWGRTSNFVLVRFKGDGALGLLGQEADVRLVLPPREAKPDRITALFNTLTGAGVDDVESRTASVTTAWMLVALGKVLGCALLLVTLTILASVLFRSSLFAILGTIALWHISNLLFDFAGLPDLSYLEMVKNMDKVLGGVASVPTEVSTLAWLFGLTAVFSVVALGLFIRRDPPK